MQQRARGGVGQFSPERNKVIPGAPQLRLAPATAPQVADADARGQRGRGFVRNRKSSHSSRADIACK